MRRGQEQDDLEAARREPLLGGGGEPDGGGASRRQSGDDAGFNQGPSPGRGLSPDRVVSSTPGGAIRLTKRASTVDRDEGGDEEHQGLVLKDPAGEKADEDAVRELEVEIVAGAVAEAVAEAVQEAVQEAVHDAVQQAIEENVQFDVRANVYTLIAVTGVILFWRGVWNTWDSIFGTELQSNIGSMVVGLVIMCIIRALDLPLVQGLPGG
ncbi:ubiquitin-conjugating enzyme [Chlorella sorokiniana]|uniref:Ubiquitin-conjugating enzyme n=1 Tax=Chlorella sorokiniana TaxID=3076 RepID=A0A2P6TM25_CHLSO|nr:ubiquitin-conjugating enzyme [Chlorella sorokiniana]|eukprot:PRW45386.1 ubiquitin-conjugating enzyme [Chlorella sorokiniana]